MDEYDGTGQPAGGQSQPPQQGYYQNYPPAGQAPVHQGYAPQHEQPKPRRQKSGAGKAIIMTISAAIIGALIVLLLMPAVFGVNPIDLVQGKLKNSTKVQNTTARTANNVVSPTQGATDVTTVARKVAPSVVNIDVKATAQASPFSLGQQTQSGTGSGVIYTADGYIITNNHVIEGAQDIKVTLASGAEFTAKLVGTDPTNDIAVVKIEKSGLPAITVGNSDTLVVGQLCIAVGSPLGFEQTVTAGIVSALHRTVAADSTSGQAEVLTNLIQTDAPINPGNSGGALCDSSSNLIGINALIASQSGGSEGIGFAIPINTAKSVADAIIGGKTISHPYIGVQSQTVSSDIASEYNLPVSDGAYVTYVAPGSPAAKAGIQTGDIIVSIDNTPVKSVDELVGAIRGKKVGDKVSITYYRGSEKKTVTTTVEDQPKNLGQSKVDDGSS
jgi:S1-C subfamily serine protease